MYLDPRSLALLSPLQKLRFKLLKFKGRLERRPNHLDFLRLMSHRLGAIAVSDARTIASCVAHDFVYI